MTDTDEQAGSPRRADIRVHRLTLYGEDADGHRTYVAGPVDIRRRSREAALSAAVDRHWDPRLSAAGLTPSAVFDAERIVSVSSAARARVQCHELAAVPASWSDAELEAFVGERCPAVDPGSVEITEAEGEPGTGPRRAREHTVALSDAELATVLAGLRYRQMDLEGESIEAAKVDTAYFDDVRPLTAAEIDALCQRLNGMEARQ